MSDDLRGKWAVCSRGRIGFIQDRKELEWGLSWVGTGIDGTPWASRNPTILCEKDVGYLAQDSREDVEGFEFRLAKLKAMASR